MRRKAQVGPILLPIVALGLVALTLYTFATFSDKIQSSSLDYTSVIDSLNNKEFTIQEDLAIAFKEAILSKNTPLETELQKNIALFSVQPGTENFYGKISRNEFSLSSNPTNPLQYKFEMQDVVLTTEANKNIATRHISLCLLFDSQGNFISYC
jgi:hypothetical protein